MASTVTFRIVRFNGDTAKVGGRPVDVSNHRIALSTCAVLDHDHPMYAPHRVKTVVKRITAK